MNSLRKKQAVILLILAVLVAYGLLLLRFSLRNDQNNYFLPVRMYMSDAFNHHEFMLWNPYLSGSYPIHCDMQGSVWNPIVIFLSWLFNYNSTLLSIELLLYLIIGAVGCFYFVRNFSENIAGCALIAISYGCCGATISFLEFMDWEASAAFLPWALHFFYLILKKGGFHASIRFAIALWLMLVCGYPSFLIYLGYTVLAVLFADGYLHYRQKRLREFIKIMKFVFLSLCIFLILSLPAIHSFLEYLPAYARGTRADDHQIKWETFSWSYPISLIFPGAGISSDGNDLYIGLVPFLILCCSKRKNPVPGFRDWFLLSGCLFTFLFTLGASTPVRMFCAKYLPLLGTFGFSHSLRIFFILGLFIWTTPKLGTLLTDINPRSIQRIRYASFLAGLILLVYLFADYPQTKLKTGLFRFSYYASAIWQLLLITTMCFSHKIYASSKRLFFFVATDLILSVFILFPIMGLSRTRSSTYNAYADRFYSSTLQENILSPASGFRQSLNIDPRTELNALKLIPRRNFPSNTRLDTFYHYLMDDSRYNKLLSLPVAFAANGTILKINKIDLGYNHIDIDVTAPDSCQMVIQQTFYKRWKSESMENRLSAYKGILLQVTLKKGINRVRLFYYRTDLITESIISVSMLLVICFCIIIQYRKQCES